MFNSFKDNSIIEPNRFLGIEKNKRSYNHLFTNFLPKSNKISNRLITKLKYKFINDITSKFKQINKTENILNNYNNNIKINTNFNNYIKNINNKKNNNKDNIDSIGYKNISYIDKRELTPKIGIKNKNYDMGINNNQRSEYIKIKNYRVKIKSPLRKNLKEMVKKQKMKSNNYAIYSTNLIKKSKFIEKIKKEEENKNQSINEENKFNNYKIYFAEKYGDGNYYNFLKKYKNNEINKLEIENELNILSKLFNYSHSNYHYIKENLTIKNIKSIPQKNLKSEKTPKSKIKTKNIKKEYHYETLKSQENCRRIIKDKLTKNYFINALNDNIYSSYIYNSNKYNNKISKTIFENINNQNYKYNDNNIISRTFEN